MTNYSDSHNEILFIHITSAIDIFLLHLIIYYNDSHFIIIIKMTHQFHLIYSFGGLKSKFLAVFSWMILKN